VAVCLHITAETANLVRAPAGGRGRGWPLCGQPALDTGRVAAALSAAHGAEVYGERGEDRAAYARHLERLVAGRPQILVDDGAELIVTAHAPPKPIAAQLIGGDRGDDDRPRASALDGGRRRAALPGPGRQRDADRARLQRPLRHGPVGDRRDPPRATDLLFAGRSVVVLGYGSAGRGIAARAKGAEQTFAVCEVDPVRALEARMEGYGVLHSLAAAAIGEVFITVTGAPGVLRREHFELMMDGAVLANAGHFDVEISLADLAAIAVSPPHAVLPLIRRVRAADGRPASTSSRRGGS